MIKLNENTNKSLKIGILTLPLHNNYGGILQAYALINIVKKFEYQPILIKRATPHTNKKRAITLRTYVRALFRQFIKKYVFFQGDSWAYLSAKRMEYTYELDYIARKTIVRYLEPFIQENISPQTKPCMNSEDLKKQTKNLDGIIVGSDQVWRIEYSFNLYDNFCDFLGDSNIKRLSYAASFGTDDWRYTEEQTSKCRDLLEKFIAVSVRESNGVQMCDKYFNRQATQVLDPTMLLTKDFYEQKFVENKNENTANSVIFNYTLDATDEKTEILEHLSKTLNKTSESIIYSEYLREKLSLPSIETWLSNFSKADFIFTDSFHGCVFSIIFNKPFITFMNKNRGNARFTSLLEMFNLKDRLVTSASELTEEKILAPIDWHTINTILDLEREKSLNFLKNSLAEIAPQNNVKRQRYSLERFVGKVWKRIRSRNV